MSLEPMNFKEIHDQILKNISDEGEIDISNCSEDQREAEIFHRFQLRMIGVCLNSITDYKKNIQGGVFQEDKEILNDISKYAKEQTSRFSLESKY